MSTSFGDDTESECQLTPYSTGDNEVADRSGLLQDVLSATYQGGKEAVVKLLAQDPVGVKHILCDLCAHDYLLHNVCLAGDEELVSLLAGGYYVDIDANSPLVKSLGNANKNYALC